MLFASQNLKKMLPSATRRGVRPAYLLVVVLTLVLTFYFLYPRGPAPAHSTTTSASSALSKITRALGATSPATHILKPRDATLIVRSRRILGGVKEPRIIKAAPEAVEEEEGAPLPPAAPAAVPDAAALPATTVAAPALASPLRTVGELISEVHPLYPYPSTRTFSVVLSTTWFTGDMPYYTGSHTCPASGCRINLYNRGGSDPSKADMLLYHLRPGDFHGEDSIAPPANGGKQLVGFMLAEGFNAADLPPSVYDKFNSEHSFRATSLVRDTYVLWFLNDAHKQGITNPQKPLSLDARVWQDIWEPPLPLAQRSKKYLASWGSHYCKGARSGREDLVRALLNAGLPLAVFGEDANCLRNVGPELLALGRGDQFKVMREHKFYLSFENHRLEGYVSEKFYWALLRGQVPVVWGASDILRHSPGPGSYIDASTFPTAKALADFLMALDKDDTAYMGYHAWRTERSFADYGDVLREELLEMIWVGNHTMVNTDWYNCRFCHAFERYKHRGGLESAPPKGVRTLKDTESPAYRAP